MSETPITPSGRSPDACREWVERKANYCFDPAIAIVWGKLHKPEELGPRCERHLPDGMQRYAHVKGFHGYAAFDLRPYMAAPIGSSTKETN